MHTKIYGAKKGEVGVRFKIHHMVKIAAKINKVNEVMTGIARRF
jgi:hypothetical protein